MGRLDEAIGEGTRRILERLSSMSRADRLLPQAELYGHPRAATDVHKTREDRRKQTIEKFSPAVGILIKKDHPDYRASAYRPIRFGPNADDKTVVELATLLEGDSPIGNDSI